MGSITTKRSAYILFFLAACLSTPIAVAAWWRITDYNADMPYDIIVFLQIVKIPFLGLFPFILFSEILVRIQKLSYTISTRTCFISGVLWGGTWLLSGMVGKSLRTQFPSIDISALSYLFTIFIPLTLSIILAQAYARFVQ
jgi:hypothetical protein